MPAARWIRIDPCGGLDFRAACAGLSPFVAAPVVLWSRADGPLSVDFLQAGEGDFLFALLVPRMLAPGRPWRWTAWGVAPALAAYRHFQAPASLDDAAIVLNGRRVARTCSVLFGDTVAVASSFPAHLPDPRQHWMERDLELVLRLRFEAQHGWEFETAWPTAAEQAAIADARRAVPA